MREGSVNVAYSSAAVVRNSSVEVRLVVFTEAWPAVFVAVFFGAEVAVSDWAFVIGLVEDVVVFVGTVDAGSPFAC